jgi:hypothetical protein
MQMYNAAFRRQGLKRKQYVPIGMSIVLFPNTHATRQRAFSSIPLPCAAGIGNCVQGGVVDSLNLS